MGQLNVSIADIEEDVTAQEQLRKVAKTAAGKPTLAPQTVREPTSKVERDGFSMPGDEYQVFDDITNRLLYGKMVDPRECVNKSYHIRLAMQLLKDTSDDELKALVAKIRPLKRGAPHG